MKKKAIILFVVAIAISGAFYGFNYLSAENKTSSGELSSGEDVQTDMPDLKTWPEASQKAAKDIQSKYGKPTQFTSDMLIWTNNGTWLKTIVYKKGMKHDFPMPHMDVVEQWINYRVPPENFDELAMFDGSITANRTNGTISARCDGEAMNILALNNAYEILKNSKAVDAARNDYGKDAMSFMKGEKPMYTQKLNFNSDPSAPDTDTPLDMKNEKGMGGQ
jgi:hypothetical protein